MNPFQKNEKDSNKPITGNAFKLIYGNDDKTEQLVLNAQVDYKDGDAYEGTPDKELTYMPKMLCEYTEPECPPGHSMRCVPNGWICSEPPDEYGDLPPFPDNRIEIYNQNVSSVLACPGRDILVAQEYNSVDNTVTLYDMSNGEILYRSGSEWKEDEVPRRQYPHEGIYVDEDNLYYVSSVGTGTAYNSPHYATMYITVDLDTLTSSYEFVFHSQKITGSCAYSDSNYAHCLFVLNKTRWYIGSGAIIGTNGDPRYGITMLDSGKMNQPSPYLVLPNYYSRGLYIHGYIYIFLMSIIDQYGEKLSVLDTNGTFLGYVKDINGDDLINVSWLRGIDDGYILIATNEYSTSNSKVFLCKDNKVLLEYLPPNNNYSHFGSRSPGTMSYIGATQAGNFVLIGQHSIDFEGVTKVGTIHWYNMLTGVFERSETSWGNPPYTTNNERGISIFYNPNYYGFIMDDNNTIAFIKIKK